MMSGVKQAIVQTVADNHWLNQPVVDAAIVAGLVALFVMIGNAVISSILHQSKITADRALATERFEFDKALAERKMALDRALTDWKRNAEFAERALSDFYEARSRMQAIRSPGSFGAENDDRVGRDAEVEAIRSSRDAYYPYLRRVRTHSNFFDDFYARRYRATALFGPEAEVPYQEIWRVLHRVNVAASMLVRDSGPLLHEQQFQTRQNLEYAIWEGSIDPDPLADQIAEAVTTAEKLFRPAIAHMPRNAEQVDR
ncbi:hypothetical protein SAMN05444678_103150 [Sphingomonas sp. YR710]|uniref:hypothetical protein n=1 Tax=Sphingomonas sp. YR710 TaxID=1882773 RepID=UPI00088F0E6B|nr:hypothetical protein [Sphingomonas sp. YR710]SDC47566.1 hypothetical protein SAMN05444678_103150 [Sphingomonas sp. YR710]